MVLPLLVAGLGARAGAGEAPAAPTETADTTSLARFAAAGDVAALRRALDAGADPDVPDADDGALPIVRATECGDARSLELLLARGVRTERAEAGGTALLEAAWRGNVAAVRLLCACGVDPDVRGSEGETPLLRAVAAGRREVVGALLEMGADPDARDHAGRTPVLLAVARRDGEVMRALLEAGARVSPPALRAARGAADAALVQALAERASPTAVIRLGPADDVGQACAEAPDGARVVLAPGRYTQTLVVRGPRRLEIVGAGADRCIVIGGEAQAAVVVLDGARVTLRSLAVAPTGNAEVGVHADDGARLTLRAVRVRGARGPAVYVADASLAARGLEVARAQSWAIGAVRARIALRDLRLQDCAHGITVREGRGGWIRGLRYRGGAPAVHAANCHEALLISHCELEHRAPDPAADDAPAVFVRGVTSLATRDVTAVGFARGIDVGCTGNGPLAVVDAVVVGGEIGMALEAPAGALARLERGAAVGNTNAGVLASGHTRLTAIDVLAAGRDAVALAVIEGAGVHVRGGNWLGSPAALGIERRGNEAAAVRVRDALLLGALVTEGEPLATDARSEILRAVAAWPGPVQEELTRSVARAVSASAALAFARPDPTARRAGTERFEKALTELVLACAAARQFASEGAHVRLEATDATGRTQPLAFVVAPAAEQERQPETGGQPPARAPALRPPTLADGWRWVPPGAWWVMPQPGAGIAAQRIEVAPRARLLLSLDASDALWVRLPAPPAGEADPAALTLLLALKPASERAAVLAALRQPPPLAALAVPVADLEPQRRQALEQRIEEEIRNLPPPPPGEGEAARVHAWRRWALVRLAAALGTEAHARAIARRLERIASEEGEHDAVSAAAALWCAALARIEARLSRLHDGRLAAFAHRGPPWLRPIAATELAAWGEGSAVPQLVSAVAAHKAPAGAVWATAPLLDREQARELIAAWLGDGQGERKEQAALAPGLLLLASVHATNDQLRQLLSSPLPRSAAPELIALAREPAALLERAWWLADTTDAGVRAQLAALRTAPASQRERLLESYREAAVRSARAKLLARGAADLDDRLENFRLWLAVHTAALEPNDETVGLLYGDHIHMESYWWLLPARKAATKARETLSGPPPAGGSWLEALVLPAQHRSRAELFEPLGDAAAAELVALALQSTRAPVRDPVDRIAAPGGAERFQIGLRSRSETGGALLAGAELELDRLGTSVAFRLRFDPLVRPELGMMALFPREDWDITPWLDDPVSAMLRGLQFASPRGVTCTVAIGARPEARSREGEFTLRAARMAGTLWLDVGLIDDRRRLPLCLEAGEAARAERLAQVRLRSLEASEAGGDRAQRELDLLRFALAAGDAQRVRDLAPSLLRQEQTWQEAAEALARHLAHGQVRRLLETLADPVLPPAARQLAAAILASRGEWRRAREVAEAALAQQADLDDARLITGLAALLERELPRAVSLMAAVRTPALQREVSAPLAIALYEQQPPRDLTAVPWLARLAADPAHAPLPLLVLTGAWQPARALEDAGHSATALAIRVCAGLRTLWSGDRASARRWFEAARKQAQQRGVRGSFWDRLAAQGLERSR